MNEPSTTFNIYSEAIRIMIRLYGLSHCGTCKKAMAFLDSNDQDYELIDIREEPPKFDQINSALQSGIEAKRMLNTSGQQYRQGGYKDKVVELTTHELAELLANNPMLIKRPFLESGDRYLAGFRESEYQALISS